MSRAQYYAVVTLNQMVLSHKDTRGGSALATKLIDIYFTLFRLTLDHKIGHAAEREAHATAKQGAPRGKRVPRTCSSKKRNGEAAAEADVTGKVVAEEVDARMLGALLTGVRRAFPFVVGGDLDDVFARHSAQLFQTVYRAPFHVGAQALMLVFQACLCCCFAHQSWHSSSKRFILSTLPRCTVRMRAAFG
jgi:ribosome biogenesis protein MAK21